MKYALCLDDGVGDRYYDGAGDVTDLASAKVYGTKGEALSAMQSAGDRFIEDAFGGDWAEAGWEEGSCIFYPVALGKGRR